MTRSGYSNETPLRLVGVARTATELELRKTSARVNVERFCKRRAVLASRGGTRKAAAWSLAFWMVCAIVRAFSFHRSNQAAVESSPGSAAIPFSFNGLTEFHTRRSSAMSMEHTAICLDSRSSTKPHHNPCGSSLALSHIMHLEMNMHSHKTKTQVGFSLSLLLEITPALFFHCFSLRRLFCLLDRST